MEAITPKKERGDMVPSIVFNRCKGVTVRDITMIHPSGWMLLPGACEDVEIFNLKQIGEVVCSDGIDLVGSKRVHIHNCFLRNNDDCVVIKAFVESENNLTATHFDSAKIRKTSSSRTAHFSMDPRAMVWKSGMNCPWSTSVMSRLKH